MNKPQTQLEFIRETIQEYGQISRNFCLQHHITRLGSRIYDLMQEGMDIKGKNVGNDYVYTLRSKKQQSFL